MNCNVSGRSTGEQLSDVGGRAVIPSGKYPKQGSCNRFQLFSHDAPQESEFRSLCVRLGVSPNVRRVPEWTWAVVLETSGIGIIPVHGKRRSRHIVEARYAPYARPIKLAIADSTEE